MSSTAFATNISDSLSASERKNELVTFLKKLKHECGTLSTEQVVIILGQWFHPLHYFPTFLSRLISVSPQLETQTYVSRILWEELGEGDPRRSHEKFYIETISDGGFAQERVPGSPPLNAPRRLVDGYAQASANWLS